MAFGLKDLSLLVNNLNLLIAIYLITSECFYSLNKAKKVKWKRFCGQLWKAQGHRYIGKQVTLNDIFNY